MTHPVGDWDGYYDDFDDISLGGAIVILLMIIGFLTYDGVKYRLQQLWRFLGHIGS